MQHIMRHESDDEVTLTIGGVQFSLTSKGVTIGAGTLRKIRGGFDFCILEEVAKIWEVVRETAEFMSMFKSNDGSAKVVNGKAIIKLPNIHIKPLQKYYEIGERLLSQTVHPMVDTDRKIIEATLKILRPCEGYVYLVQSVSGHYKIGRTRNVDNRLRTFNVKLPFEIELTHVINSYDMVDAERILHARYAHRRVNGEWFALSPDDVTAIKSIERL